jgi:GntR family transcriptional repressor for pyruvate dehydrogenase complex
MTARPLDRASLPVRVADDLASRLAVGEWQVGERLPSENALAETYGVGRSTIREAIRTLAARGQLTARQGDGVYVLSATPESDVLRLFSRAELADVVEARGAIEAEAARLAALRVTPSTMDALRTAEQARTAAHAAGPDAFAAADVELHRALVAASGNPVIVSLFEQFAPVLDPAIRELTMFETGEASPIGADLDEHAAIVDAVCRGASEEAAAASRRLGDHLVRALR